MITTRKTHTARLADRAHRAQDLADRLAQDRVNEVLVSFQKEVESLVSLGSVSQDLAEVQIRAISLVRRVTSELLQGKNQGSVMFHAMQDLESLADYVTHVRYHRESAPVHTCVHCQKSGYRESSW